jgi:hypothetical protein
MLQTLFFHYFLQRLAKLAVAAWSCLVVASKTCLTEAFVVKQGSVFVLGELVRQKCEHYMVHTAYIYSVA